jgi:hypothetical protein
MIHRRGFLMGAMAVAILPRAGFAATKRFEDFRLEVNWGGMHVADLALGFQPDGSSVGGSMTIASRGMASLLTSYGGEMSSKAQEADGRLISQHYRAHYKSRRYTRDIEIRYDEKGDPTDITLLKRGEPQTVDIPRKLWADTVDPLTGILRIRRPFDRADLRRPLALRHRGERPGAVQRSCPRAAGDPPDRLGQQLVLAAGMAKQRWPLDRGQGERRRARRPVADPDAGRRYRLVHPAGKGLLERRRLQLAAGAGPVRSGPVRP